MEVDCEGCAGCCIDWRAIAPEDADLDHERRGRFRPIDDAYNVVVLTRGDVRALLDAGLADAMTPRLFHAESDAASVTVDGVDLAAVDGRPVFYVGLRKPPKPVGPFGTEPRWLPTCAFLDPETLQCRVHGDDEYPSDCADYPGHNLALGAETECERVERAFGGERLLDDEPGDLGGLLLGPQAVGEKVFAYPEPDALDGVVRRVADGRLRDADRARFVAAAAASAPGTTEVSRDRFESALERALAAESWVGEAAAEWAERADAGEPPEPSLGERVEEARGAPGTPGWDAEAGRRT